MSQLQEKMAEHGFESNDDYQYHVKCFFSAEHDTIRTMNIEGEQQRRKTAFANALALALEYPKVIYYDFSQQDDIEGKIKISKKVDEDGIEEPEVSDLDHIMSEACALSEGEKTILILDQLHLTDFKNHINLYHFIINRTWTYNNVSLKGNPDNLVLILISEAPLYHSLQKCSFRIWINTVSNKQIPYKAIDFGLTESAQAMMDKLSQLFLKLGLSPTTSEYKKILHDIHFNIENEEHLIHSLYAWTEGIDRTLLHSSALQKDIKEVVQAIHDYLIEDELEL